MIDQDITAAAAAFAAGDVVYLDEPAELPPTAGTDIMVPIALRVPTGLHAQVRTAAEARGITISAAIREWIELGITADRDDQVVPISALRRAIAHAALSSDAA